MNSGIIHGVGLLNAVWEEESLTGASNTNHPEALDEAFLNLDHGENSAAGSRSSRAVVAGELTTEQEDVYTVSAKASDTLSFILYGGDSMWMDVNDQDSVVSQNWRIERVNSLYYYADSEVRIKVYGIGNKTPYSLVINRNVQDAFEAAYAIEEEPLLKTRIEIDGITSGSQVIYGHIGLPYAPLMTIRENTTQVTVSNNDLQSNMVGSGALRDVNCKILHKGIVDFITNGSYTGYALGFTAAGENVLYRNTPSIQTLPVGIVGTAEEPYIQRIDGDNSAIFRDLDTSSENDQNDLPGGLHFQRAVTAHADANYCVLLFTEVFTNNGTEAISNLRFLESFDPNPGGTADTSNAIDFTKGFVIAENNNGALLVGSADPRARWMAVGKELLDPNEVLNSANPNQTSPGDDSVHIAFHLGTLQPGERTQVSYLMTLGGANLDVASQYYWNRADTLRNLFTHTFRLPVISGQRVSIDARVPSGGPSIYHNTTDPALRVYDPDGAPLAQNDDAYENTREAAVEFVVEKTGDYLVELSASTKPVYEEINQSLFSGGDYVLNAYVDTFPYVEWTDLSVIPVRPGALFDTSFTIIEIDGETYTVILEPGAPDGVQVDPVTGRTT